MIERRSDSHVLSWAAIGVAAAAVVVACFLPDFEIAVEASIGAGSEQRAFRYTRKLAIAIDLLPFGLLPLAAGLALVACAAVGVVRGSRPLPAVLSFPLAVGLAVLAFDTADRRLDWPGDVGVIGYEEPNGGPLLQPAIDDLQADARRSPEAQEPGWELGGENFYAARGRTGWGVFEWSAFALTWLTAYRLARVRFRPARAALLVAGMTVVILAWLFERALSGLE